MGYDNVPLASYSKPPLSTVRFSGYLMGTDAGEMLIELIDGKIKTGVRRLQEIEIMKIKLTLGK
jgi:DNA-binding LacI/PurR family transcriptional regulator